MYLIVEYLTVILDESHSSDIENNEREGLIAKLHWCEDEVEVKKALNEIASRLFNVKEISELSRDEYYKLDSLVDIVPHDEFLPLYDFVLHSAHYSPFVSVQHVHVYKVEYEDYFYYVKDKDKAFDIRKLKNWGYGSGTKLSKDVGLHKNAIKEGLYHTWLNDYLKDNDIEPIYYE